MKTEHILNGFVSHIFAYWLYLYFVVLFYRRLCPDISFFQQATDFPCLDIVGVPNSDSVRLHNRVQYTALSSGTVERRGIGMSKVTNSITPRTI